MLHQSSPTPGKSRKRFVLITTILLVGLVIGCLIFASGSPAPSLWTANSQDAADTGSIKLHLQQIIQNKLQTHEAEHVSIYFRDLSNGSGFGIGEDYKFTPASLMKVPVMIAHLKLAEEHPEHLNKQILFSGGPDHTGVQGFKPLLSIQRGQTYTIDELIQRMISYSDNNALALLLQNIEQDALFKVLNDLHVDYAPTADGGFVTLKDYANFFQALYNASYLDKTMSDHALDFLAHEEFKQGISAGVPPGTTVAAKFGEWAIGPHSEKRTLQQVGIVYFTGHPYLLGVEIEGPQIDKLSSVIREISHEVYAQVSANSDRRKT